MKALITFLFLIVIEISLIQIESAAADLQKASAAFAPGSAQSPTPSSYQKPPVIIRQPKDLSVLSGGSALFQVAALGASPLKYQWYEGGVEILGATNAVYSMMQATNTGIFTVVVANLYGKVTSEPARLSVENRAVILSEASSLSVKEGNPAEFAVKTAGSSLRFQWFFNGDPIVGATNSTFNIPIAQASDAGSYQLKIRSSLGVVESQLYTLAVLVPPIIRQQPIGGKIPLRGTASLFVVADGSAPLSFQWLFETNEILNAHSNTLVLEDLKALNQGSYSVRISNAVDSVVSAMAQIEVLDPIIFVQQPIDQKVTIGSDVTFTSLAKGSPPLFYQWRWNGNIISGATNSSLTLPSVTLSNGGTYRVEARNAWSSELSQPALLSITTPLTIVKPPQSQSIPIGGMLRLTMKTTGSDTQAIQWYWNGLPLANETNLVLSVKRVSLNQVGEYTAVVRDAANSITSAPVVVTIKQPPNLKKLDLPPNVNLGSLARFSGTAEGDGPFTYQWLRNGNPIPGETNESLSITDFQLNKIGSYSLLAQGPGGVTVSEKFRPAVRTQKLTLSDDISDTNIDSSFFGVYEAGNNGQAKRHADMPEHIPGIKSQKTLWFSWRAPADGVARFTTIGSDFDTILAVYTGDRIQNLQRIAYDEDGGGYLNSALQFNAQKGVVYRIAIDGFRDATGEIVLSWLLQPSSWKLPQILSQPISYTAFLGQDVQFNTEISSAFARFLTIQWYRDDTLLAGATNTTLTLRNISISDTGNYRVRIGLQGIGIPTDFYVESDLAALQINLIRTGQEGPGAHVKRKFNFVGSSILTPFASGIRSAQSVSRGYSGAQVFSTRTAVKEPGEPNHAGVVGGASMWSMYMPTTNGMARISTEGSDFDTVLAVYTGPGTDFESLVEEASDNNSGADGKTSVVVFSAKAGTTYFVVVDGVNAAKGTAYLTFDLALPPTISPKPLVGENTLDPILIQQGVALNLQILATNLLSPVPLSYQWRWEGSDLNFGTNAFLIRSNATSDMGGAYRVTVSNYAGSITSAPVLVSVQTPVQITQHPASLTAAEGTSAVFSLSANGSDPLRYQWFFNNSSLAAETNSTLVITQVLSSHSGQYRVEVSNDCNVATSQTAELTFIQPPVIITPPQSVSLTAGGNLQLNVIAQGAAPLQYQWFFNGALLPGATSALLELSALDQKKAGEYSVMVSNLAGAVISAKAQVSVVNPVSLQVPVTQLTVTVGDFVTLSVNASGSPPLFYRWMKNGTPLVGQEQPELIITQASLNDAGDYSIIVSNAISSLQSQAIKVEVLSPPSILQSPQNLTIQEGNKAQFLVEASGSSPIVYQWFFNGDPMSDATQPEWNIPSANASHQGCYQVLVSNVAGAELSSEAYLTLEELLLLLQKPSISNGLASLKMTVPANRSIFIEVSSDLNSKPWTTITNIQTSSGLLEWPDIESTGLGKRFYRLRLSP